MQRISELHVNGKRLKVDTDADRSLLSVLRDDLDLTGSKYGCGEGQCGACTVLIDGQAVRSCITKLGAAAGKQITTIEGIETLDLSPEHRHNALIVAVENRRLHPLQEAFLEADALQCGYCTPGMIMSGCALLSKNPNPSNQEIVRAMEGNLCRCGTYPRIVTAIRKAAQSMKGAGR